MKVVFDNLANFLSISPTKPQFLPTVCLVPAGHFCRSCFFSSCTLSRICILRTMYMFSHPHIRLQLYTCFLTMRSKHASSKILNDMGRNSLLGNRKKIIKKIAKFLMRTFTCRSTFLYVGPDQKHLKCPWVNGIKSTRCRKTLVVS